MYSHCVSRSLPASLPTALPTRPQDNDHRQAPADRWALNGLSAALPVEAQNPPRPMHPPPATTFCSSVKGALRWPTLRWAGDLGIWWAPSDISGSFSEEEEGRTERLRQKTVQLFAASRPGLPGSRSYTEAETDRDLPKERCPSGRLATPDLSPGPQARVTLPGPPSRGQMPLQATGSQPPQETNALASLPAASPPVPCSGNATL